MSAASPYLGYDPLRRCDTLRQTKAEAAILEAMRHVEAMPADTRLTDAVTLLDRARASVADFVDGVDRRDAEYGAP